MKAILTWFKALFAASANGPQATSQNSSLPSKPSSTPAPSTPAKPKSEAKASEWIADPRSEKNLATLEPQVAKIGREHLRRLAALGLTFKVTSGRRTQAEQDALYAQGRTKPGPVVTWTRKSRHLSGRAYDLTLFSGKNPVWESKHYTTAGELGEKLGMTWGGRWKKPDRPHFELPSA
jgi:peptidoglycan L-alanyl-D-glutamate endopeptidase CwlK